MTATTLNARAWAYHNAAQSMRIRMQRERNTSRLILKSKAMLRLSRLSVELMGRANLARGAELSARVEALGAA